MDCGPDFADGVMWVFTVGEPSDDLMRSLAEVLDSGNRHWVLVPVMTPGLESFEKGEIAYAGIR